jgi:gag-polypeptide of LTR copia-type
MYRYHHRCNLYCTNKTTVLDPENSAHKPEIAKRDQNIRAFMLLTLAMSVAVSFEVVGSGKTTDMPDGDAKLAWTALTHIFQPNNKSELQAFRQQFNHCALTDASYPTDKWFAKLETLKIEMKNMEHEIDDNVMIAQILFNTQPAIYNTTIEILTRQQSIGTAVPTLFKLKMNFVKFIQNIS